MHGWDGVPLAADGPVAIPCFAQTPWSTFEPTLGFTASGTLLAYPAYLGPAGAATRGAGGVARQLQPGGPFERLEPVGEAGANPHQQTLDPFLFVDPFGGRAFVEDLVTGDCAVLSTSDDAGATWHTGYVGCLQFDHEGYASGPPVSSVLDGYPALVQRCGIQGGLAKNTGQGIACQKSVDGGRTWSLPGGLAFPGNGPLPVQNVVGLVPGTDCVAGAHHPVIDARGWLWIGRDWCGVPTVAVSKDEGATWSYSAVDDEPGAEHDVAVAVDPSGTAYAAWVHEQDWQYPLLAVSKDGGVSWSEPRRFDLPGTGFVGGLSITAGGPGRLALSYAMNTTDGTALVQGVVALAVGLDTDRPVFQTAYVTTPGSPLAEGTCLQTMCSEQMDFLDDAIAPDGTPWGTFVRGDGNPGNGGALAFGWLWGGPGLWGEADPNGPFP